MKQRSTTPFRPMPILVRISLSALAVLLAIAIPIQLTQTAKADKYDDQINALQGEIAQYQREAAKLSKKADSLKNELAKLTAEKRQVQTQIDLSQAKFDKLTHDIAVNKKKIADNREALGHTIAQLYVDNKISPLEMLASSNNIGDYIDKQANRSAVRDNLSDTIEKIEALKKELEKQKVAVERVLNDQKAQRQVLAQKESQRQAVLAATRGQKAQYEQLTSKRQAQIDYLREQQRLAFAAINPGSSSSPVGYAITYKNWSGNTWCGGGYSYCYINHLDQWVPDDWGLNLGGECVHYVADWLDRNGYYIPYNAFSVGNGYGGGNANKWIPVATGKGFGRIVSNPAQNAQRGDVAYMAVPGVGHVGIVEHNYGNGWVRISQYNFATYGSVGYSTMDLMVSSSTQFLRIDRR